jgi:hypothetical protein
MQHNNVESTQRADRLLLTNSYVTVSGLGLSLKVSDLSQSSKKPLQKSPSVL